MSEHAGWPAGEHDRDGRDAVFREAEYQLNVAGRRCYVCPHDHDWRGRRVAGALGADMCELLDGVEMPIISGTFWSRQRLPRAKALELWGLVRERTRALAQQGRIPEAWADVDAVVGWPRVELLCRILAESMVYAAHPLRDRSPRGLVRSAEAFGWNLAEALDSAIGHNWLLPRVLRGQRVKANCRVFASALQLLFAAGKQASQGSSRHWVVGVMGKLAYDKGIDHIWNWFMDADSDTIMAFDLSCVGNDRQLGPRFDASRRYNTSGFLASLLLLSHEGARPAVLARRAFMDAVEPLRPAGAMLLFELLRKRSWHHRAGPRVARWLESIAFDRVKPDWHRWRGAKVGGWRADGFGGGLQDEILDQLGLPR